MHFLHIGKTGGTSLKKLTKTYGIRRTGDGQRLIMHSHSTSLPEVLGRHRRNTAAFFLRDPVTRFVSGFNSRLREGAPIAHIPWKPEERLAFERFSAPNDLAEALSAPSHLIQDRAFTAMRAMVHTRMHYKHWLRGADYLQDRLSRITFIGFQETYVEDVARFARILGLPDNVQLEHHHQAPANMSTEISANGRANLERWYAEDYVIYRWALERRDRWALSDVGSTSAAAAVDAVGGATSRVPSGDDHARASRVHENSAANQTPLR